MVVPNFKVKEVETVKPISKEEGENIKGFEFEPEILRHFKARFKGLE